jgi:RES domain-containing protein
MLVYRISSERYVRDLSGEGGRLYGGRWNRKGIPAIYTSEHLSLAAMEFLVNTPLFSLPVNLKTLVLQIPENCIQVIEMKMLPEDWRGYPAPDSLKETGSSWLLSCGSLVLKVPSAVIESEYNYIINPQHPLIEKLIIKDMTDFHFGSRLISQ